MPEKLIDSSQRCTNRMLELIFNNFLETECKRLGHLYMSDRRPGLFHVTYAQTGRKVTRIPETRFGSRQLRLSVCARATGERKERPAL